MKELIERIEGAEEGSRELDAEIAIALDMVDSGGVAVRNIMAGSPKNLPRDLHLCWPGLPKFSASLDAAITLVPEGCGKNWSIIGSDNPDGYFQAEIAVGDDEWLADAHTPALALVAAALKARGE